MALGLGAFAALLLLFASQLIYCFIKNITSARAIGLPTVVVPIDQTQLLWVLLSPSNRHRFQRLLPARLWQRLALSIFGWEFHEKMRPFDQFAARHSDGAGKSYLLVGLRKFELWTADPKATQGILLRHHDFEVPHTLEYALGQFGPNVLTTNGDRWTKHRRIVTTVIDERISKIVFEQSARQSHCLVDELFPQSQDKLNSTETSLLFDMLKKVTIHVLLGTSMGTEVPWNDKGQTPEPGYKMTHIESLKTAVTNIIGVGILPTSILTFWPLWLPGHHKMRTAGHAKVEVYKRSKSILDQERDRGARSEGSTTNNIMNKLLQVSEDGSNSRFGLSESEMISNLFVFTAAGFETTATTLAYSFVLLARYPQWQGWLLEEVDSLLTSTSGSTSPDRLETMDYPTIFPQATRTMAFMFETLRLYSPVPHVHRETTSPQTLETSTGTVRLPANTRIYVNSVALHLLPLWRDINRQSDPPFVQSIHKARDPDEYAFRPSRWLNPSDSAQALYHPPKGTWVPWAMGPRVCPGQKMAQVEFTAVMLTILRRHRIEAAPFDGEGRKGLEDRLDARLRDSRWVTVLQMNGVFNPEENEGLRMRISKRR